MAGTSTTAPTSATAPGNRWLRTGGLIAAIVLVVLSVVFHLGTSHLALLGLATIAVLLAVIMTDVMTPLIALIAVPIAGALAAGFKLNIGQFIE